MPDEIIYACVALIAGFGLMFAYKLWGSHGVVKLF